MLLTFEFIHGQNLVWQKSIGGSSEDMGHSIISLPNGKFVVAGGSFSTDGDITNHFGFISDILLYSIDSSGTLEWLKSLGGSRDEVAMKVIPTFDNGLLIVGQTSSYDFQVVPGIHGGQWNFFNDVWVVKTNSIGNIEWQKCFGGTGDDLGYDVTQLADSGFLVIGETESGDGDILSWHGSSDIFLIRTDKSGNKLWAKTYGGSSTDIGKVCLSTSDGGFLIGGGVVSNDYDVSGNHNANTSDIWLAKLDSLGNILWSKCFGGTGPDDISNILIGASNGFYICGTGASNDGDISGSYGANDIWVFKIDSIGNLLWQQCYGGSYNDITYDAIRTIDSGICIIARTTSTDGLITNHRPGLPFWNDYLVLKIDTNGSFQWSSCYGGSDDDMGFSIAQSQDGLLVVVGECPSNDYDVTNNHGTTDSWTIGIRDNLLSNNDFELRNLELVSYFNEQGLQIISKIITEEKFDLSIYSILGSKVFKSEIQISQNSISLSIPGLSNGVYFVVFENENKNSRMTSKIVKR